MTILATLVLLGVLIFVHELGHFWAAKAVGVGVERFSVGLGPRIWGFNRGETEYVIAAIPLGGYVKMQGMEEEVLEQMGGGPSEEGGKKPAPGDFDGKPLLARALVISAGVIMNIIFAFVVYAAVAAGWGEVDVATTRVMAVDQARLPPGAEALAGVEPGARIVQVGAVQTVTWGEVGNALREADSGPVVLVTESPAGTFELQLSDAEEERVQMFLALQYWMDPVVGGVNPDGPADRGSVRVGDVVTSVEGVPVVSWSDMVREIRDRPGQRAAIGLTRDGEDLVRVVELDDVRDVATGSQRGQMGIYPAQGETVNRPVGLADATKIGLDRTYMGSRLIVNFLADLVTLDESPRSVGSIGTIWVLSGQAAERGLPDFLSLMALLSINLAILNLLPIPILDGGHLVFLGIELVRGQPLSVKQRVRWSRIGIWAVIFLMVWALGNDALRLLG